ILPSLSLPPLECCFGTSPIQAEKFRPDRKAFGSATLAIRAVASAGPTPGISSSRLLASLDRCQAMIRRSNSKTNSLHGLVLRSGHPTVIMAPRLGAGEGPSIDGSLGGPSVESAPAAEKVIRVDEPEHHVGIGHGSGGAAVAVAGGSRLGASALRPNVQDAARIDAGDRAAAGADAYDIKAVKRHAMGAHGPIHDQA